MTTNSGDSVPCLLSRLTSCLAAAGSVADTRSSKQLLRHAFSTLLGFGEEDVPCVACTVRDEYNSTAFAQTRRQLLCEQRIPAAERLTQLTASLSRCNKVLVVPAKGESQLFVLDSTAAKHVIGLTEHAALSSLLLHLQGAVSRRHHKYSDASPLLSPCSVIDASDCFRLEPPSVDAAWGPLSLAALFSRQPNPACLLDLRPFLEKHWDPQPDAREDGRAAPGANGVTANADAAAGNHGLQLGGAGLGHAMQQRPCWGSAELPPGDRQHNTHARLRFPLALLEMDAPPGALTAFACTPAQLDSALPDDAHTAAGVSDSRPAAGVHAASLTGIYSACSSTPVQSACGDRAKHTVGAGLDAKYQSGMYSPGHASSGSLYNSNGHAAADTSTARDDAASQQLPHQPSTAQHGQQEAASGHAPGSGHGGQQLAQLRTKCGWLGSSSPLQQASSVLSEQQLAQEAVYALQGVTASVARIREGRLATRTAHAASLTSLLARLAVAGQRRMCLDAFVAQFAAAGGQGRQAEPVLQAFAAAAQRVLRQQDLALQQLPGMILERRRAEGTLAADTTCAADVEDSMTVLEVAVHSQSIQVALQMLSAICWCEPDGGWASKSSQDQDHLHDPALSCRWALEGFPCGSALLTALFSELQDADTNLAPLLRSLFLTAFQPYLAHMRAWLYTTAPVNPSFASDVAAPDWLFAPGSVLSQAVPMDPPAFLQPVHTAFVRAGQQLRILHQMAGTTGGCVARMGAIAAAEAAEASIAAASEDSLGVADTAMHLRELGSETGATETQAFPVMFSPSAVHQLAKVQQRADKERMLEVELMLANLAEQRQLRASVADEAALKAAQERQAVREAQRVRKAEASAAVRLQRARLLQEQLAARDALSARRSAERAEALREAQEALAAEAEAEHASATAAVALALEESTTKMAQLAQQAQRMAWRTQRWQLAELRRMALQAIDAAEQAACEGMARAELLHPAAQVPSSPTAGALPDSHSSRDLSAEVCYESEPDAHQPPAGTAAERHTERVSESDASTEPEPPSTSAPHPATEASTGGGQALPTEPSAGRRSWGLPRWPFPAAGRPSKPAAAAGMSLGAGRYADPAASPGAAVPEGDTNHAAEGSAAQPGFTSTSEAGAQGGVARSAAGESVAGSAAATLAAAGTSLGAGRYADTGGQGNAARGMPQSAAGPAGAAEGMTRKGSLVSHPIPFADDDSAHSTHSFVTAGSAGSAASEAADLSEFRGPSSSRRHSEDRSRLSQRSQSHLNPSRNTNPDQPAAGLPTSQLRVSPRGLALGPQIANPNRASAQDLAGKAAFSSRVGGSRLGGAEPTSHLAGAAGAEHPKSRTGRSGAKWGPAIHPFAAAGRQALADLSALPNQAQHPPAGNDTTLKCLSPAKGKRRGSRRRWNRAGQPAFHDMHALPALGGDAALRLDAPASHALHGEPASTACAAAQSTEAADESGDAEELLLPVAAVLDICLLRAVREQHCCVSTACLRLFQDELRLPGLLAGLRRYYLMQAGDFAENFVAALCSHAAELRAVHERDIQGMLEDALKASSMEHDPFASTLQGRLAATSPSQPGPSRLLIPEDQLDALNPIQLRCDIPWPQSVIVTPAALAAYQQVFSALLRLRRVGYLLQMMWRDLAAGAARTAGGLPAWIAQRVRQVQLFQHSAAHLVGLLQRHMQAQLDAASWDHLQAQPTQGGLMDVIELQQAHLVCLERAAQQCMLGAEHEELRQVVDSTLQGMLAFRSALTAHRLEVNGNLASLADLVRDDVIWERLEAALQHFHAQSRLLYRLLQQRALRGQFQELVVQMGFNSFYAC